MRCCRSVRHPHHLHMHHSHLPHHVGWKVCSPSSVASSSLPWPGERAMERVVFPPLPTSPSLMWPSDLPNSYIVNCIQGSVPKTIEDIELLDSRTSQERLLFDLSELSGAGYWMFIIGLLTAQWLDEDWSSGHSSGFLLRKVLRQANSLNIDIFFLK